MPLTNEAKNDLRRRVLAGERLDVATAKQIVEELRAGRRFSAESAAERPTRKRKQVMSDEALDADLDSFLGKVTSPTVSPAT